MCSVALSLLSPTFSLLSPVSFLLRGSQDSRPLPDPATFYRAVRENLVRAQRATHLYTYKDRRTDVHVNPFGRLGTGGTRLFEVFPSAAPQLSYRRLIERNGMPVSARDLAEQDRQYRAKAADVQRRIATRSDSERRRLDAESAQARERAQRMIEDVVNTLQFTLKGRGIHGGVPAIVITFTPKPNARPATREGRIAEKFAGTVWVDEAAAEVMHVEARSIDDLTFGFGIIARLGEGTTATLTRRPVDGDLWMPTGVTLTGRGRAALFFRSLVVDYAVDWFEYRRLPDDSPAPFLDPRVHGQPGRGPQ